MNSLFKTVTWAFVLTNLAALFMMIWALFFTVVLTKAAVFAGLSQSTVDLFGTFGVLIACVTLIVFMMISWHEWLEGGPQNE